MHLHEADRLYIIAAGTSYHAGLIGKQYFEKIAGIPVEVHISSEFGYNMPLLSEKPLFIFITQSGETADSRQVLVKIKELGYPTITMTNVPGSTLSREADHTLLLHAGPEIAVASTKAYVAQVAVLAYCCMCTAQSQGKALDFDLKRTCHCCKCYPNYCGFKRRDGKSRRRLFSNNYVMHSSLDVMWIST